MAEFDIWPGNTAPTRTFPLADLRAAALSEYPEFGRAPWPVPWWRSRACRLAVFIVVYIALETFLGMLVS